MPMKKYFSLSVLIFFLGLDKGFSQDVWNLQHCIQYAIEHNLQLKQSKLSTQTVQVNNAQAKLSYLPNLSGDATQYFSYGRSLNVTTNAYQNNAEVSSNSFSISSNLPVFAGLTKYQMLKQTESDLHAAKYDEAKMENDIALNVAAYYLSILNALEQLKIMQRQKEITEQQVSQTQKLIDAGAAAEISIKDVEATLANDKLNIVNAQNNYDVAILNLKKWLSLDVNQTIQIDTIVPQNLNQANVDLGFENTYQTSHSSQPAILSSQWRVRSADRNVKYNRGILFPTLSLFGTLRTSYSSASYNYGIVNGNYVQLSKINFNDQVNQNYGRSFGFDLSIPINNGFQNRSAYKRSAIQYLNAKLNLEIAEKQLQQDVANAILNVKGAASKLEATKAAALATQTAFDANTKKYEAGVINNFDYTTSKNNAAKSLSDLANAKFDYLFKIKILNYYQGKPLY